MVRRYPVVLGIDEQELNQGTYTENGVLHGLLEKLDVSHLKIIGLENLADYILKNCPYISSVREYRLTDLVGAYCSNIYTQYIAGVLKTEACIETLKSVVNLSRKCETCLENNFDCNFNSIKEPCQSCIERKVECVSLVVFHVLWDMGSCHKSTAKTIDKISEKSTPLNFENPNLQSIGFGGLHLSKSPTNGLRNHVFSFGGQNYGLNILRALKNTSGDHTQVLANLKTAVLVGKDRQSDLLSYMCTAKTVQDTLKLAKNYQCTRIPEQVLSHTERAKKQKKIILPTGIQCNRNGDVFLLDAGSSCIYSIDRSSVANMYIVGTYACPSTENYKSSKILKTCSLRLSNNLCDVYIPDTENMLFVADSGRNELIIIRNCSTAISIKSSYFNLLKIDNIRSISTLNEELVCLRRQQSEDIIEIINLDLPRPRPTSSLVVTGKIIKKIKLTERIKYVFKVVPTVLGLVTTEKEILFYSKLRSCNILKNNVGIKTAVQPQTTGSSITYFPPHSTQLNHLNVSVNPKTSVVSYVYSKDVITNIPAATHCIAVWGSTFFTVSNVSSGYKLIEYGSLSFGLKLCKGLNSFYDAISYIPPHGYQSGEKKTMQDCIDLAQPLLTTFMAMQKECKVRFPTRSTFLGIHGMVFSDTLECIKMTVDSWKSILARLEHFDSTLLEKVNPHTVTNEALIEHAFGFIKGKGQSQLLSMKEYIHNKMKHEVDFQLRLCKTTFCQHVKVKLRDKSYQHLDAQFNSQLSIDDIWEILFSGRGKKSSSNDLDDDDEKLLRQAYLMTKSVPRQSNRAKWKENSGFAPSMLIQKDDECSILKGDMVFCQDLSGTIKKLIVKKTKKVENINDNIVVGDVENSVENSIPVTSLLKDKGLTAVIPASQYEIEGTSVVLSDLATEMLQEWMDLAHKTSTYTDEEIVELTNDPDKCLMVRDAELIEDEYTNSEMEIEMDDENIDFSRSGKVSCLTLPDDEDGYPTSSKITENEPVDAIEDDIGHSKRKKVRQILSDDDDDDQELIKVGNWVVSKFVLKSKMNYYLGQIQSLNQDHPSTIKFQFYRSVIPNSNIYIKLLSEEVQDVSSIVQHVPKSNIQIVSGEKVELLGFESIAKLYKLLKYLS